MTSVGDTRDAIPRSCFQPSSPCHIVLNLNMRALIRPKLSSSLYFSFSFHNTAQHKLLVRTVPSNPVYHLPNAAVQNANAVVHLCMTKVMIHARNSSQTLIIISTLTLSFQSVLLKHKQKKWVRKTCSLRFGNDMTRICWKTAKLSLTKTSRQIT